MKEEFSLTPMQIQTAAAVQEVRNCEPLCERYGLRLSEADMLELVESRKKALSDSGRIEFGGGILPKLIYAFCDSPYIENVTWAETLAELQEAFYTFKSESQDRFTDDELVDIMVKAFNGPAQGSLKYLTGTVLQTLCRSIRQEQNAHDKKDSGDSHD